MGSDSTRRMPVLFVGHGSPMNAISDNPWTRTWKMLGEEIPRPKAIVSVSAHWFTPGSRVQRQEVPPIIYDMYGFPQELYEVTYPVAGNIILGSRLEKEIPATVDDSWGIDHGTWSVLVHMYPGADIPVLQLSIDRSAPAEAHYELGRRLAALRDEGVLVFGSGNVVHNLRLVDWSMEQGGYPWADDFDTYIHDHILQRNDKAIIDFHQAGDCAVKAVPTPDHYYPLLYVLGASDGEKNIRVFNYERTMGSLSMTGYLIG